MLRWRKQMKYCVNSLVALAAANLTNPCGSLGTRAGLECVPCLAGGDHVDCLSTGSCFGWKTCRLRKVFFRRAACCWGNPPAQGTSGWRFWGMHRGNLLLLSGCSDSAPMGPPRWQPPTLLPPRQGCCEKEYSLSLFE